MSTWLRLVLAAQLAFFALWGAALVRSGAGAPTVWLATEPVDPRDFLSGNFVALRYRMSSAAAAGCELPTAAQATPVYVRLEDTRETADTAAGPVPLFDAVACVLERPTPMPGEHWIVGSTEPRRSRDAITYGIERFYVAETSPLRDARSGSVVAKIAIADDWSPMIQALVPITGTGE